MLCHERKRTKHRDAYAWEINPLSPPNCTGWLVAALEQKQDFLPEMKSLQHQNNQEVAPLSHWIAKKGNHIPPTAYITAGLIGIFCATRAILNTEQHRNAKQCCQHYQPPLHNYMLLNIQLFCRDCHLPRPPCFPFQGSLKTENIWILLDMKRFLPLLAAVSLLHL